MLSEKEEKAAPKAVKALLDFVRRRKLDVLVPHIAPGARMSAVGFINNNLDEKEGSVAEVLMQVLPESSGGAANLKSLSLNVWQIDCYLTRHKGEPVSFLADCTLDSAGKISNIRCEIEPAVL